MKKLNLQKLKEREKKPVSEMTALQVADAMTKRLRQIEAAENKNDTIEKEKQLFWAKASERKGQKVAVTYINYQGSSELKLKDAQNYLKFLMSIKTIDEFKTHWQFFKN